MVIFAAATGMRPGEWVALERRDIDREAQVAYVRRSFSKGRLHCTKTEASVRAVPLQSRALDALDQLPRRRERSAALPGPARRLPRPAQLPQPQLEARPDAAGHRALPPDLRSPPHLRDLRTPSRHLDVRALPLHGRQPHHDRPPLRPPRPRRTRARDPAPRRPQRRRGGRRWTLGGRQNRSVDARTDNENTALSRR